MIVDQIRGDLARRCHGALADAQLPVHNGRIIQNKGFGRGGGAAFVQKRHRPLQYSFGMLTGIGHCCRTAHKDGICAVEAADAD